MARARSKHPDDGRAETLVVHVAPISCRSSHSRRIKKTTPTSAEREPASSRNGMLPRLLWPQHANKNFSRAAFRALICLYGRCVQPCVLYNRPLSYVTACPNCAERYLPDCTLKCSPLLGLLDALQTHKKFLAQVFPVFLWIVSFWQRRCTWLNAGFPNSTGSSFGLDGTLTMWEDGISPWGNTPRCAKAQWLIPSTLLTLERKCWSEYR